MFQRNVLARREHTRPFGRRPLEQVRDDLVKLLAGAPPYSEIKISLALACPRRSCFIKQLCVNELENLLEGIDASVSEYQILHVEDHVFQARPLCDQDVLAIEIVDGPGLVEH